MSWRLILVFVVCLFITGCADSGKRSDDSRFGGFYGGVSGGVEP